MSNVSQEVAKSNLTPKEVVEELGKYVIGQDEAKRAVAIALRNRWRRQQLPEDLRERVTPKNIILIGSSGVGKTEVARQLAKLVNAPFVKVEATNYTEVGYVGSNVESMIGELLRVSARMVREEMGKLTEASRIKEYAEDIIIDLIQEQIVKEKEKEKEEKDADKKEGEKTETPEEKKAAEDSGKNNNVIIPLDGPLDEETLRKRLREGELDRYIIAYNESIMSLKKDNENDPSISSYIKDFLSSSSSNDLHTRFIRRNLDYNVRDHELTMSQKYGRRSGKISVEDATALIRQKRINEIQEFTEKTLTEDSIKRAQEFGIIFIDEIDKIADDSGDEERRVSGRGVQRQLLSIVEGCSVETELGAVKTDHILFIAAGAFHLSKPSDLIPELQGRFPIRVELETLTTEHYRRILTEPTNNVICQYTELLRVEGINVEVTEEAISAIAEIAYLVNSSIENIGARRLYTIMERVFEDLSFDAPEMGEEKFVVTADYVREKMAGVIEDNDISRYIL